MKYKLTTETINVFGITLFRIEALVSFGDISKGYKGGFIEKESNLSQVYGDAWVCGNAQVSGDAQVSGNAQVYGDAQVSGDAQVYGDAQVSGNAWVSGDAQVSGNAQVYGDAWVSGNAQVYGDAWVYGNAQVSGDAQVSGNAWVSGNAQVYGDAWVSGNAQVSGNAILKLKGHNNCKTYLTIGPIGLDRFITIEKEHKIINAGCFSGTVKEFEKAVKGKYGDESDYYPVIKFIKTILK